MARYGYLNPTLAVLVFRDPEGAPDAVLPYYDLAEAIDYLLETGYERLESGHWNNERGAQFHYYNEDPRAFQICEIWVAGIN